MASEVGDIYQLTLFASFLGQAITNVFHYRLLEVGSGAGGADNLGASFADNILDDLIPLQSESLGYTGLVCMNLHNLSDFVETPLTLEGLLEIADDNNAPSYVALVYRYGRTAAGQRYGYKRFSGLVESQISGNAFTGNVTDANDLATALIGNQGGVLYDGWSFKPFIASRPIVYGDNPSGYVPPNCVFRGVTTQVSRRAVIG